MEDLDIAKGMIEAITGLEIVELAFSATERSRQNTKNAVKPITLYRLDFKAKVRDTGGQFRNILIEIQKAKLSDDITRFRNYLGRQYQTVDELPNDNGEVTRASLPIVVIYILGYPLDQNYPLAIHAKRVYQNPVHPDSETPFQPHPFIEALSHDAYFIQIPKAHQVGQSASQLEKVFSVFDQNLIISGNKHILDIEEIENPLVAKMLRQLNRDIADPDIQDMMQIEDEIISETQAALREHQTKINIEVAKRKEEEARRKEEEARRKEEETKRKEEETKRKESDHQVKALQEQRERSLQNLIESGMDEAQAKRILGIND
jgi:hypothetical protein